MKSGLYYARLDAVGTQTTRLISIVK